MQEYIENNRKLWDGMVPFHVASDFYDVASFKAGRNALLPVELAEVGDVRGKSLLHLQCHFGMDTLSWARLGASVTGVDFSAPALEQARALSAELDIPARFVESDIYQLQDVLQGQFDIVFASYGVICWLPDFPRWASIAAGYVKPGGCFYLIDAHPFMTTLDAENPERPLRVTGSYDSRGEPAEYVSDGTYAAPDANLPHKRSLEFNHPIGQIVTSLIDAGLKVEFLHEFPFAAWQQFPEMEKRDDGYYHLPDSIDIPLMFSLRASKGDPDKLPV